MLCNRYLDLGALSVMLVIFTVTDRCQFLARLGLPYSGTFRISASGFDSIFTDPRSWCIVREAFGSSSVQGNELPALVIYSQQVDAVKNLSVPRRKYSIEVSVMRGSTVDHRNIAVHSSSNSNSDHYCILNRWGQLKFCRGCQTKFTRDGLLYSTGKHYGTCIAHLLLPRQWLKTCLS